MDDGHDFPLAELTNKIIGAAIEVHRELGPGLLESAYRACLMRQFELAALGFRSEVPISLLYKGYPVDCGFRADLIVDAQLLTYLKLCSLEVGLILNFNETSLRKGIRRFALSRPRRPIPS